MTFRAEQPRTAYIAPSVPRLKADCLSYVEVLAQSVSVVAPSTVPAAVLGLIFAAAGHGTWLSFLIRMLGASSSSATTSTSSHDARLRPVLSTAISSRASARERACSED